MGGMDKERFLMGSETEYGAIALDEPPPISLGTLIAFLKILKEETGGFRRRRTGLTAGRGWSRTSFQEIRQTAFLVFGKQAGGAEADGVGRR